MRSEYAVILRISAMADCFVTLYPLEPIFGWASYRTRIPACRDEGEASEVSRVQNERRPPLLLQDPESRGFPLTLALRESTGTNFRKHLVRLRRK